MADHPRNLFASRSQERRPTFGFARARSAELLSNALMNFVGQSVILHGASQYYAADHRGCLKYGFFPVSTLSGENVLKSLLERGFEFRGQRALWFLSLQKSRDSHRISEADLFQFVHGAPGGSHCKNLVSSVSETTVNFTQRGSLAS